MLIVTCIFIGLNDEMNKYQKGVRVMMKKIVSIALVILMLTVPLYGCKKTDSAPAGNAPAAANEGNSQAGEAAAKPGTNGGAGKAIQIKVTTVQLDGQQMGIAANNLKQLVDERLAGKVDMAIYTGGQLYSNTEELEALKKGDIQLCLAVGSTMNTLDPAMGIFKLPFLFPNVETAYYIMDGPVGDKIFANIQSQGINVLGGFSSGAIVVSNSSHPIVNPEDLSGLKMRASGKMESAIIEAMGAISTVIPSEETYTGLQQKVVDGLATPSTVFAVRKYQEVQKYVTNAGLLYWSNGFILANDKFWQGLPEDIRAELAEVIQLVLDDTRNADGSELQNMLAQIESEGCEVHTLTPDEREKWRQASMSVYDDYSEEIGPELIAEVQKAVEEYVG